MQAEAVKQRLARRPHGLVEVEAPARDPADDLVSEDRRHRTARGRTGGCRLGRGSARPTAPTGSRAPDHGCLPITRSAPSAAGCRFLPCASSSAACCCCPPRLWLCADRSVGAWVRRASPPSWPCRCCGWPGSCTGGVRSPTGPSSGVVWPCSCWSSPALCSREPERPEHKSLAAVSVAAQISSAGRRRCCERAPPNGWLSTTSRAAVARNLLICGR